jgi:hypothetical protein
MYDADEKAIGNVEAWAEIIGDMLFLVPVENRMEVLELALANEKTENAERAKHGGLRIWDAGEMANMNTPGLRHWNVIMRLKSLVATIKTTSSGWCEQSRHRPRQGRRQRREDVLRRQRTGHGQIGERAAAVHKGARGWVITDENSLMAGKSWSCGKRKDSNRTPTAEATLRDLPEAARALGLQIQLLNASTSREVEAAFDALIRDRADALFVVPDPFLTSQSIQIVTLAVHHKIPTAHPTREAVEVGGLMAYGPDNVGMYRQVGVYTGQILNGAKPADLPVMQSTKFEFVINLQTARALGIEVPYSIQLLADEVIE